MGVKSCSRLGCDNIMCDRYSYKHGYICEECFDELVATGPCTDISKFLKTEKTGSRGESYARYEVVFPIN